MRRAPRIVRLQQAVRIAGHVSSDGAKQDRRSLDCQAEDFVKAVSGSLLSCMTLATVSKVYQPRALYAQVHAVVLRRRP